ncbi:MAG: sulfate adenylyltransferase, partial [Chloroflexi bacterium]|nr:sulfate adenylyltransferase [Chloroflexota bacterium]
YVIQHTTRTARALVPSLEYGLDVNTLGHDPSASTLRMNEIGQVTVKTSQPLFVDAYRANRATGSFILIDEGTSNTVAAGMVL